MRLSGELLQRWDDDPDAGYRVGSPFTLWWSDAVSRSVSLATDSNYIACLEYLDRALTYTVHATQSDLRSSPAGLQAVMQAMECWSVCEVRHAPVAEGTFDLEDLEQAFLLVAFQFDSVMGSERWSALLQAWFISKLAVVRSRIELGQNDVALIAEVVAEGEDTDLDSLESLHWVLSMLDWFRLEDAARDVGVDVETLHDSVTRIERELRAVVPRLRRAGAVVANPKAPRSFWWRH
jgi:hypothetical protein